MFSHQESRPLLQLLRRAVDVGAIFIAGYLSLYLRFNSSGPPNNYYDKCIYGGCLIFMLIASRTYAKANHINFLSRLWSIYKAWIASFLLILIILVFTQSGLLVSRIWLAAWAILGSLLLILNTAIPRLLTKVSPSRARNNKKIALIGSGIVAEQLLGDLKLNSTSEYKLLKYIAETDGESIKGLENELIDEVWIALQISDANKLPLLLHHLRHSAANIKYAPDLFTFRLINHGLSETLGVNMINLNASPFLGENRALKNTEDFLLSLLILTLISPLMLLLAAGVKLTSPGPIFYSQERVGLNGRPFRILKFRSMPVDTEKNGIQWGGSDDKATHPIAKLMRRLNLDELPQFINVLKGEMSIVGPRPERIEFINEFREQIPNYMKKHLVKAGITGWAQIHGLRGDTDLVKRIEYDLFYIENWSLKLDLKIILLTIIQTFTPLRK